MKLKWDEIGKRFYETGVDHTVLYPIGSGSDAGTFPLGVAWNGITAINESPSGAEPEKLYADNIPYLTMMSAEELGLSVEAYTYPDEFGACDGTAEPATGVQIGQQTRKKFGLAYRSLVGNDVDGNDHGHKLHLVWNCLASPSEKDHGTVNESPEATTFSWDVSTEPVVLTSVDPDTGKVYKPTASISIDSTKTDAAKLAAFEQILYGTDAGYVVTSDTTMQTGKTYYELSGGTYTATTDTSFDTDKTYYEQSTGSAPRLPMPDEVIEFFRDNG